MCRNPRVTIRPTSAPRRSSTAFVATVVPWRMASSSGRPTSARVRGEPDALDHADRLVLRRARRLREPDALAVAVVEDDVRERPAHVDAEAIRHAVSLARRTAARYFSTRTSQLRAWPSKFSIRHWRAQISPIMALAASSHSWKVTVLRNLPTQSPPV